MVHGFPNCRMSWLVVMLFICILGLVMSFPKLNVCMTLVLYAQKKKRRQRLEILNQSQQSLKNWYECSNLELEATIQASQQMGWLHCFNCIKIPTRGILKENAKVLFIPIKRSILRISSLLLSLQWEQPFIILNLRMYSSW